MNSKFKHPTNEEGRVPESVALIAMGPSKSVWIQDQITMNPQIHTDEIWTLNAGVSWVHGYDLIFYMDDMLDQCTQFPGTLGKLRKATAPIITTRAYPKLDLPVPQIEYPLEFVLNTLGPQQGYFMNSIPYIIAYALSIGVKRLMMFGVDYDYPGVGIHEPNRANCEYWCGFAHAKGMAVQVPDSCTLLGANKGRPFYGYARQPVISVDKPQDTPVLDKKSIELQQA